ALDLNHADELALPSRRPARPSLTDGATRTETPDGRFGLARDPAPAVPPSSFRLGSPPPRLGTHGPPPPGPGTPDLPPPGPSTPARGIPDLAPPGPSTPARGIPDLAVPGPSTPAQDTSGLAVPGPITPRLSRPDPAAADLDPFGLRGTA